MMMPSHMLHGPHQRYPGPPVHAVHLRGLAAIPVLYLGHIDDLLQEIKGLRGLGQSSTTVPTAFNPATDYVPGSTILDSGGNVEVYTGSGWTTNSGTQQVQQQLYATGALQYPSNVLATGAPVSNPGTPNYVPTPVAGITGNTMVPDLDSMLAKLLQENQSMSPQAQANQGLPSAQDVSNDMVQQAVAYCQLYPGACAGANIQQIAASYGKQYETWAATQPIGEYVNQGSGPVNNTPITQVNWNSLLTPQELAASPQVVAPKAPGEAYDLGTGPLPQNYSVPYVDGNGNPVPGTAPGATATVGWVNQQGATVASPTAGSGAMAVTPHGIVAPAGTTPSAAATQAASHLISVAASGTSGGTGGTPAANSCWTLFSATETCIGPVGSWTALAIVGALVGLYFLTKKH